MVAYLRRQTFSTFFRVECFGLGSHHTLIRHGPAPRHEAKRLVQAVSPSGIVGVHTQCRELHACFSILCQCRRDELRGDTSTPPFGKRADVVDPGVLRTEQIVVVLESVRNEVADDLAREQMKSQLDSWHEKNVWI